MATLTFVIYCLSQHPDVLLHLREEILTKIGPSRKPTFDDVKDCKYMRAVINGTYIITKHFDDVSDIRAHCRNSSFISCRVRTQFPWQLPTFLI